MVIFGSYNEIFNIITDTSTRYDANTVGVNDEERRAIVKPRSNLLL